MECCSFNMGQKWDELINNDKDGLLQKIMNETDGEYQNYKAKGGKYTRENFFGKDPEVLKMINSWTDQEVENLNRGGHDPIKIYNAYRNAYEEKHRPTVILAFTIKGYGIGSRQADNTAHQVKKLTRENLEDFIQKFNLPVTKDSLDSLTSQPNKNKKVKIITIKEKRIRRVSYLQKSFYRKVKCKRNLHRF